MDKHKRHQEICDQLHDTYLRKNKAYGNSFGITFQELGIISALTRMTDKWNRIKALAKGTENKVNDEAIEDTLLDLANYCIMTVMEIESSSQEPAQVASKRTYLDLAKEKSPDMSESVIIEDQCPHHNGFNFCNTGPEWCNANTKTCTACWNREVEGVAKDEN